MCGVANKEGGKIVCLPHRSVRIRFRPAHEEFDAPHKATQDAYSSSNIE